MGLTEGYNRGIVIASNAPMSVMAHEIGHSCGLRDIYDENGDKSISLTNLVRQSWEPQDWSGGLGTQYYHPNTPQTWIISHLLMYGYAAYSLSVRDIPLGTVWGIYNQAGSTNYDFGQVKVGLDNNGSPLNRNPFSN